MTHDKKSAAELRAELRGLRKEKVKPISKMRMGDISAEIERLRVGREETPAPAATPSGRSRQMAPSVESIKKAKMSEFPIAPASGVKKMGGRKAAVEQAPAQKKKSKADRLMAMLEEMTDSEDE